MKRYSSHQFPQGKPKIEVWELFDCISKCRITYGAWIICDTERKRRNPNNHLKILPYKP